MGELDKISIAIVDDHPIVRQGLSAVISGEAGFNLIAEGSTAREALEIAERLRPQIMLLDLGIPGGGLEALKHIVARTPSVRCMILTVCDLANTAISALNAGAKGYVLKGVSPGDLKKAMWTVINDESFVSPEFATKLLQAAQLTVRQTSSVDQLTHREAQIMKGVEEGLTNREIGEKLDISEKTVKYYMSGILQKYGVTNRVSAVIAAQKLRTITLPLGS
ncbi:response regulator transcription factor [Mesorhizobium sp. B3-1-7]|uniref:response regulator n=1 Tax=Mesorhizobium sp. B3-1-7 TaxID=2589894 RepID=UPI0015E365CC|nr:response regulator transcription factor [Mesorhizobium sp. B3-1-7]